MAESSFYIPEPAPIPPNFGSVDLTFNNTGLVNSQIPQVPISLVASTPIDLQFTGANQIIPTDPVTPVIPFSTLQIDTPTKPASLINHTQTTSPSTSTDKTTTINLENVNLQVQSPQTNFIRSTVVKTSTGLWSWFANSRLLNKFAEKAKSSVDTMITTLDPGMREFIYSGGDVRIFVATSNPTYDFVVMEIRDAFQRAFGRATVTGEIGQAINIAPQSVGFSAALKAAEEKISTVQREKGYLDQNFRHKAFVATQSFVVELVPDRWYDVTCLVLRDERFDGDLQVFSQPCAIPPEYINKMQDSTPPDYPLRWSGFATTVGQASMTLAGSGDLEQWREIVSGVPTKDLLAQAAKSLACMYCRALAEHQQWP